jgi:Fungal fucose-specific lectin
MFLRFSLNNIFEAGIGDFSTEKIPRHSSINALGWYDSGVHLRVYWHDSQQNFVSYEYEGSWKSAGTVLESLPSGTQSSAIGWDKGKRIRFYYQGNNNDILEECNDGGAWFTGSVVATSS